MKQRLLSRGFTIVELLIVIVVIAVLAAITLISYNSMQQQAAETAVKSDLVNVSQAMTLERTRTGSFPNTTPNGFEPTQKVAVSISTSELPYYNNLSAVQNGVLLSKICQDLIDEGKGRGTNLGGGTENYITGCGNWNHDSMQVTGWTSRVFTTPISANTFPDYAGSLNYTDAWNPSREQIERTFYLELRNRLTAQGGSFPVTSFWDSWANSGNGGVIKQELPAASEFGEGVTFCAEAIYNERENTTWHVRRGGVPTPGACS